MTEENIQLIIDSLNELSEDTTVPKNVKIKVQNTLEIIKSHGEISVKVNKALHELDEIANDTNMQSYTRTQIWNVVSLLEKLV